MLRFSMRVVGKAARGLDRILGERRQAAGIDPVDADVRPRGRRDDLAHRVLDGGRLAIVEVVDVVVDAFAQVDDGLAPAVDAVHVVADVPQRIERRTRIVAALQVERVVDAMALAAVGRLDAALSLVLVEALQRLGAQLPAEEAIDARDQEPLVARELLSGLAPAARVDHRRDVVGGHRLLDELPRGPAHQDAAGRGRLEVVEHDDVHAALERLRVGRHVGLDRLARDERLLGVLDRDVHEGEGGDVLRLALLQHLEILPREVVDEAPLAIEDRRVHLDVVDLDAEGHRWLVGGGRLARRGLLRGRASGKGGEQANSKQQSCAHACHRWCSDYRPFVTPSGRATRRDARTVHHSNHLGGVLVGFRHLLGDALSFRPPPRRRPDPSDRP